MISPMGPLLSLEVSCILRSILHTCGTETVGPCPWVYRSPYNISNRLHTLLHDTSPYLAVSYAELWMASSRFRFLPAMTMPRSAPRKVHTAASSMLTHIEVQGLLSVQNLAEQLTSPLPTRSSPAGGSLLGQKKQSENLSAKPQNAAPCVRNAAPKWGRIVDPKRGRISDPSVIPNYSAKCGPKMGPICGPILGLHFQLIFSVLGHHVSSPAAPRASPMEPRRGLVWLHVWLPIVSSTCVPTSSPWLRPPARGPSGRMLRDMAVLDTSVP